MTVYIDKNYKCHVDPTEGLRAFDVPFFDGKCSRFIEGYRYVPSGETWVREDGEVFNGEMITPFEDYHFLAAEQARYEIEILTAKVNALSNQVDFQEECLVEMANIIYA